MPVATNLKVFEQISKDMKDVLINEPEPYANEPVVVVFKEKSLPRESTHPSPDDINSPETIRKGRGRESSRISEYVKVSNQGVVEITGDSRMASKSS